jgi:TolB-like protein
VNIGWAGGRTDPSNAKSICGNRLNSWKEIAVYLDRDIRTIQLWEKNEALPIHRHLHSARGTVFAYQGELDSWLNQRCSQAAGESAPRIMLAVLPFENLSGDPDQDYFSDGLTEELILQLGRLCPGKLGVIARTSAMCFKRTRKTIGQIGRELGVDHILEGSIRQSGNRVRITAQLVTVRNQIHVWANTYDRELVDTLRIQGDVGAQVVDSLAIELLPRQEATLIRTPTRNHEARDAFLKGRYFCGQRTEDGLWKGIEYFNQAISIDPGYALAFSGLADCYTLLSFYCTLPPKEAMPKAKAAALKALELDPELGEAHASLGDIRMAFDWDWSKAREEYEEAIRCNSSYATAYHWYANYLVATGDHANALTKIEIANQFDPLSLIIIVWKGMVHFYGGHCDQAIEQCMKALEMDPSYALAHWALGQAFEQKSMFREATREYEKAVDLSRGLSPMVASLGHVHAVSGKRLEAIDALEALTTRSKHQYVPPYDIAMIHVGLGDYENALTWLQKAFAERSGRMSHLWIEPRFKPLGNHPDFLELLGGVGLLPFAASTAHENQNGLHP